MFIGRQFDAESGLYFYRNRYYDAKVGRFTTRDPLGHVGRHNLYIYCSNNPVNFIDPWGLYEVGFKGIGNPYAEEKIEEEIRKEYPDMPDDTIEDAAEAFRKEMTAGEYIKLKDDNTPKDEKKRIAEDVINRAKDKPENQELKKEIEQYSDKTEKENPSGKP